MGDIVMASVVIEPLRRHYPRAKIVWLVQQGLEDLLDQNPLLDEVISWPKNRWKALWRAKKWWLLWQEMRQFKQDLRQFHFDLALDLQGLLKSGVLAWWSRAPQRIGLGSREGSQFLMTRVLKKNHADPRFASEYLQFLQTMGLQPGASHAPIVLSTADEKFVIQLKTQIKKDHYLIFCPFTTRPQKHWFPEMWRSLAQLLHQNLGKPILILGGTADLNQAQMLSQQQDYLLPLAGQTQLRQAAALIKYADLVIGVDTGLTHMGITYGTPTIALFGSTCPYLDADLGTGRANVRIIYHRLNCSPCQRKPTCHGAFHCMRAISPEEVLKTAMTLLSHPA